MSNSFYFHHGWRFRAADAFPLKDAVDKCRDRKGRAPTDRDYHDRDWEKVTATSPREALKRSSLCI